MWIDKQKKRLKNFLLSKLLKGNNVHCNVCNRSFSTFISHMDRTNACCPNCGSLERTRLIWYYIKYKKILEGTLNLLHVAPERYLYELFDKNSGINYFPVDKFTKGYKYPSNTIEMDITALNFKDQTLDGAICIHVLEHVLNDMKALEEFYRVLKPNAWAVIQVPFDKNRKTTYEDASITNPEERLKHFGQSDHVRIYGTDFIDRFVSAGFKVEDWNFQDTIAKEIKVKYVFKDETIFLLRK